MIDPDEAQKIKKNLILHNIYYSPTGYYSNSKSLLKMLKASDTYKKEGHWFHLNECKIFLKNQESYQINKTSPKYIPRASYGKITWLNCMYQADILFFTYDKYKRKTYKAMLNIIDCTFQYKASVLLTFKNSLEVARAFKKKYDDSNNSLIYSKLL